MKKEGKLLDHDYDGIQELDNPLPGWWVKLFYVTIIFGVIYFIYYTFGYGNSIQQSFDQNMAAIQKENKPAAEQVSEVGYVPDIAKGKAVYAAKCASCHGQKAEGMIGPNLTDPYWMNGKGTDTDIYTSISEGIPEKGMIAWKALLSENDIKDVVAYIQSLQGSNPANAKAPQGELVE